MSSHTRHDPETTTLETRYYQGARAGVGLTPDEIFVDFALPSPRYFRVRRGDLLMEGDVRGRSRSEIESARVRKWEVVEVTPDRVVGRDRETGDREEWGRTWVEEQLVRGGLSTDLSDFERVTVVVSGDPASDPRGDDTGDTSTDARSALVALFGDDGKKYLREYAFVDPENATDVRLVREDQALLELTGTPRTRLATVVERALDRHGYVVVDSDGSEGSTTEGPADDAESDRPA